MYCEVNFKSKKELKAAVDAYNTVRPIDGQRLGAGVRYFQTGPFGGNEPRDGKVYIEGPHYPKKHTWYAECVVKDGYIVKVK